MVHENELEGYFLTKEKSLTHEERRELVKRVREGDEKARKKLITSNIRLVVSTALKFKKYRNSSPVQDLIQEGVIKLMEMIDTYDPDKGYLSSYTLPYLKGRSWRKVLEDLHLIRLNPNLRGDINRVTKTREEKYMQTGKWEDYDEAIKETIVNSKPETIKEGIKASLRTLSLDAPNPVLDSQESFGNNISDERINLEREVFVKTTADLIRKKLEELCENGTSKKDVEIVKKYYGIGGEGRMNSVELGIYYGVTRERIRQIKERVEKKLKVRLSKEGYTFDDFF